MNTLENKTVLIIGDAWQYIEYYLIDKLHINVVLFQEKGKERYDKPSLYKELHYLDFSDKDKYMKLAYELHKKYNFICVASYNDIGAILACEISKALELRCNNPFPTTLVNNKAELRRYLRNNNISEVTTYTIRKDESFTRSDVFPCIAKPIDGSGSVNVKLISNRIELDEYLLKSDCDTLIEEVLDGPEISVETLSFNKKHTILQITDKFTENFVEVGHMMPSQFLDNPQLREMILDFLDRIHQENGPCHIEVKMTKKGPKIVEAHTRPGGDFIVLLLADIFNVDVLCLPVIFFATGIIPDFDINKKGGGAVLYFNGEPGIVKKIKGFEEVIKDPNVINYELNIKIGDIITKASSSFNRSGCIVVKAETGLEAFNYGKKLIKKIKIITEDKND